MKMVLFVAACLAASAPAADGPRAEAPLSRAAACKLRFEAFCAVMHRCSTGADDLGGPGCEAIDPGCDRLEGTASYPRDTLDACLSGLSKLTCKVRVDPSKAAGLEESVAACAAMTTADDGAVAKPKPGH